MNVETNEYLKENLEEAHGTFCSVIEEMKTNNIKDDYYSVELEERELYNDVSKLMVKLEKYVSELDNMKGEIDQLHTEEFILFVKYAVLYAASFLFLKGFHTIFDTKDLPDMAKYGVGMFLGSTYVGLLCKDLYDGRNDSKERRDLLNKYRTMKEEYKVCHDEVVFKINRIFKINSDKWQKVDDFKEMVR